MDPERSIGAYLTRQRELRGISLEELATLTRIPRRSLARLESGVFDRAPDGFVRGFVRTVAAALGLDPDETVMRLLCEPPVESAGERAGVAAWASPSARWAMLAVAGILAAAALGWLATSLRARSGARPDPEVVLRTDPIRELAREAAARAQAAAPESSGDESAPGSPPAPAEPAGADEIAHDAEGEELAVPEEPEAPPAAAPPAAPEAGAVQQGSPDAGF